MEIKGFELCASMRIKGVYTSNILYSPITLPKEIQFVLHKSEQFE